MRNQVKLDAFELIELGNAVTEKQMHELVKIVQESLSDQAMFQLRIKELPDERRVPWIKEFWLQAPLSEPRYRSFAIRDLDSDTLVAWTALQHPATQTEAEKQKTTQTRSCMMNAIGPEGRAFLKVFAAKSEDMMSKAGYDPEKHFHKRNTLILPSFQKRGLGTWLTRHCNEIVDLSNRPTYVIARPKAWKMFEDTGFKVVGEMSIDCTPFGWDEQAASKYYRRDPPNVLSTE